MRKNIPKIKTCPFLDKACVKDGCGIYNEAFERCEIGLLIYKLYQLTAAIKSQLENEIE